MEFGIQRASSSYTPSHWKYDVFLSFRGEDTRKNFTDHLYAALSRAGIVVFKDDKELDRGKLISQELLQAIEESKFLIIVFSKNYASSSWCLDELAKIADCINTRGRTIIPIFYNVEPSVVRNQMESFEEAFIRHEENFQENMSKVKTWRDALRKVADISGWDMKDRVVEGNCLHHIQNMEFGIQRASSSYTPSRWKYGVFLSFRGEDTRKNFTDYLYAALIRAGIIVFKDDKELDRGKVISQELLQAIEESEFLIIVFSKNYASSSWCLDELAKIADCINTRGQTIIPIFYNLEPSVVRKQMESFEEAFIKHEENFKVNMSKVKTWRDALRKVADISGWNVKDRHESEFIEEIVKEISSKLSSSTFKNLEELVGVNSRIQELMRLISEGPNYVRMIGIWGMGGIGKTTIARVIYELISSQFEGCSFLADIRETSEKDNLICLQKQILFQTLRGEYVKIWDTDIGAKEISKRLRHKKVLIILDDVAHVNELDKLARNHGWFGFGSRIIITTRNKQLLHGVDYVYEAKELNNEEALQLFCLKAFKKYQPPGEYLELSKSVVKYADGLPLAVIVLGSFLFGRDVDDWKSALERLTRESKKDIIDILEISLDGLSESEKNIFLDIACFFKGVCRDYVIRILDACGFSTRIGISVLIEKSLLKISNYNKIMMHDLLQELGQRIVERESPKEPEKCSRLWKEEDVHYVLTNNKGTKRIEGIVLNFPKREVHCNANAFSKMINLRLLKISRVHLSEGHLDYLSNELRLLDWNGYPLESLPPSSQLDKVVELNLDGSRIKQMPQEIKFLNMKSIRFANCQYLTKLPDFRGAPYLEDVILYGCKSLREVDSSFLLHENIKFLSMGCCTSLRTLPKKIHMKKLQRLMLPSCSKLKNFPEVVGSMDHLQLLDLSGTAIEELPSSVELFTGILRLRLTDCKDLVSLPIGTNALKSLRQLYLDNCSKIQSLSESFGEVEQPMSSFFLLKNVYASFFCGHSNEPPSNPSSLHSLISLMRRSSDILHFRLFHLKELDLSCCNLAEGEIPSDFFDSFPSLWRLCLSENNFVSLPASISHLRRLEELYLVSCKRLQSLPELPSNTRHVNANNCVSLETLSNTISLYKFELLGISCVNCFQLMGCKYSMAFSMLKEHLNKALPNLRDEYDVRKMQERRSIRISTFSVVVPGSEITEWFSHQNHEWSSERKRDDKCQKIRIKWPPYFCNRKLLGFVLGCVFRVHAPRPRNRYDGLSCFILGGQVLMTTIDFREKLACQALGDHLWLLYVPCHVIINNGYYSRSNHIEFSFEAPAETWEGAYNIPEAYDAFEFKVCGLHLVYEDDAEEFNKIDDESRFWNVNDSPQDLVGNEEPQAETLDKILSIQGIWA